MPVPFADWQEPSVVPHESILYMGASLEYSPRYEAQKRETCEACGGVVVTEDGDLVPNLGPDDPIARLESIVVVCLCNRSNYAKLRGREHRVNHYRPSHRAGGVKGRPNPKFNAYLAETVKKKRKPRKAG
jgi:hypothetical protein